MKKQIIAISLLAMGVGLVQADTLFTDANPTNSNVFVSQNWNNGLATDANPGTINSNAVYWRQDPVGGGSGSATAVANKITGLNVTIKGTSSNQITFRRAVNFLPEFQDSTISLEYATMDQFGTRVLRLSGTTLVTVGTGADLTLALNKNIEFQNDGAGAAQLVVNGGTVTALGIGLATDNASYAFLTFGAGDGLVDIINVIDFTGDENLYINFLAGSGGVLDVSNAADGWYEALWGAGNLRVDGANIGTFASNFNVSGTALTVIPEPATLGTVAAVGAGILFIRRRLMM